MLKVIVTGLLSRLTADTDAAAETSLLTFILSVAWWTTSRYGTIINLSSSL
jgi:hypothetical protein